MKTKKQYTTPTVKVVSFKVEEAFQSRGINLFNPDSDDYYNNKGMQMWNTGDASNSDNSNNSLFNRW